MAKSIRLRFWARASKLDFFALLFISGLLAALIPLTASLFPASPPLVVIDAQADLVRYRVTRPQIAKIAARNGVILDSDGNRIRAKSLLVSPAEGAVVTYRNYPNFVEIQIGRIGGDDIGVLGQVRLIPGGAKNTTPREQSFPITSPIIISIKATDTDYGEKLILPLAGAAEIGTETVSGSSLPGNRPRPASLLYGGNLSVYGQSKKNNELYPVAEFEIPFGSRLTEISEGRLHGAPWFGSVIVQSDAFNVRASVESEAIQSIRPGPENEYNSFGISILSRLIDDPFISYWTAIFAAFFVIVDIAAAVLAVTTFSKREDKL